MKGSQVLGEHTFCYVIYPHDGDWNQGLVAHQADRFNVPLEPVQAGPHGGTLPKSQSFLELEPVELQLACIKQAEGHPSLVVRFYNPVALEIPGSLTLFQKPRSVRYLKLNEEPLYGDSPKMTGKIISLTVGAKKIVTLEIEF